MGFLVGVVLIMGFVSEFSSLATFAGFVTAGIAVGLQAVLLSVAAYFFVVGRYGIRVGDRISIAGVTGDVVDIGLVRLYIMELAGVGYRISIHWPHRRVLKLRLVSGWYAAVQADSRHGIHVAWTRCDSGSERQLQTGARQALQRVKSVYETISRGNWAAVGRIERQTEIQLKSPRPDAKLQLSDTGVEFIVRYPRGYPHGIRNRWADHPSGCGAGWTAIQSWRNAIVGTPKIRAAIKGWRHCAPGECCYPRADKISGERLVMPSGLRMAKWDVTVVRQLSRSFLRCGLALSGYEVVLWNHALGVHRLHFAFTITFHYIFPQLTMGLALLIVYWKPKALRTNDEHYNRACALLGAASSASILPSVWSQEFPWNFSSERIGRPFSRAAGGVYRTDAGDGGRVFLFSGVHFPWLTLVWRKKAWTHGPLVGWPFLVWDGLMALRVFHCGHQRLDAISGPAIELILTAK